MQNTEKNAKDVLNKVEQYDTLSQSDVEYILKNIEKSKIDKEKLKCLLDGALELGYGYNIIDNVDKFDLNEEERFNLARDLVVSYGKGVIRGLEKFNIEKKEYKTCLAETLIEKNHGDSFIENIQKFSLDKESLKYLLDKAVKFNYGYSIIDNIDEFDLNEDERFNLAIDVAENLGQGNKKLVENIDKFNISSVDDRFDLTRMLIKDNSYNVICNIKKFNFDTDYVCRVLEDILLAKQDYLLFVNKLKDLFEECGKDSIIYMNKIFNLVISQKSLVYFNGSKSLCRSIIDFYQDFCNENNHDQEILDKTINNLQILDSFCFDVNFDMAKILGDENANAIKNEIKKIKNDDVRYEINIILDKILFSYDNIYSGREYRNEITNLILEFVVIKDKNIKRRLLPLAVKYINDGNLKHLSSEVKNNNKAFDSLFEILLERFSLYNKTNEELYSTLMQKFKSSNFLKNSINVQKVIEAFIELDNLNIRSDKRISILNFLCANITNITRNMQYIANIIELGYDKKLNLIKGDSDENILKNIYFKVYAVYLKMNYGSDFIESYEKFVLRKDNEKRKLEEHIMTYVINICTNEKLMEVTKKFLNTMYDIKEFRKLRYDVNSSEHLKTIQEINKGVYKKWILEINKDKEEEVRVTDDPVDLFLIGTEVDGSCQRVGADISYNKCLMAYVMDGKNKAVVISKDNRIIARSIIRLLLDYEKNEVVMVMEKMYKRNGISEDYVDKLKKRCVEYAKWLNVSLIYEDKSANPNKKYTVGLLSKSSIAPYEYFDIGGYVANNNMEQHEFINMNLVYLYKKKELEMEELESFRIENRQKQNGLVYP